MNLIMEQQLLTLESNLPQIDDYVNIQLSQNDYIGRSLKNKYNSKDLLRLHSLSKSKIIKFNNHYKILNNDKTEKEFILCHHKIYTAINANHRINQCLRCP